MAHIIDMPMKEGMTSSCSYSLSAISDAKTLQALINSGMTEEQVSTYALSAEYGVIKGKIMSDAFSEGDLLFTGVRTLLGEAQKLQVYYNSFDASAPLKVIYVNSTAADAYISLDNFETYWMKSKTHEWSLGKAAKKIDVQPGSGSVGAMSDEDAATLFVKTKDELATQKGILDLKGQNVALDNEVYEAIAKKTGYKAEEIKAKINAYKKSGKKLSSLKKKVLKDKEKVPAPNGVPVQATKQTVDEAVDEVVTKVEDSPKIAEQVYQNEDVSAAYIKAKDDLASLESNDWTLYTQTPDFESAIMDRMRDHYGISLDDHAIQKAIADYVSSGKKLSALKKKLANSKTDPWTPKADTLKSKESSFHISGPVPASPSTSVADLLKTSNEFDIGMLDSTVKETLFNKFKSGIYLTSSPESIYEKAIKIAKEASSLYPSSGLAEGDALAILKIVDERSAIKFGVTNENLYEKKVVGWLQTAPGKQYVTAKVEAEYWIKNQPPLPTDSALFNDISTHEASAMQAEMGQWTATQKDALRTYTGGSYREMNQALRTGRRSGGGYDTRTWRTIHNAEDGMKPVTRNLVSHRGTSFTQFGVKSFEELIRLVGQTMTDEGFVSTSVGSGAAFGGSVRMDIEVPRGAKAAYVQGISHYSSERELLLAPKTQFRILQVSKDGNTTVVRCRVVV